MAKVYVWDLPVRLFHWSLVVLVFGLWWSAENAYMEWHARMGYGVLFLVIFRLIWGLVGSSSARFCSFLHGPKQVIAYLRGQAPISMGHNPAGGWMVMVLLLLLISQATTGLLSNDDIMLEGPWVKFIDKTLSDFLTHWHKLQFKALALAIGLHVSAVLFYLLVKRENLVRPMLTGYKHSATTWAMVRVSFGRALVVTVLAAAIVGLAISV